MVWAPAQAAAGAAPGAGSGGAGVGGRLAGALAGAFPLAAGALLVVVALLALLVGVGVLLAALAGAVAGGAAAAGAVLAAAAGVVGLAEGGAAVRAVGVDGGDHRFVTSRANEKATRRGGAGWPSGRVDYRRIWTSTRTSWLGGRSGRRVAASWHSAGVPCGRMVMGARPRRGRAR